MKFLHKDYQKFQTQIRNVNELKKRILYYHKIFDLFKKFTHLNNAIFRGTSYTRVILGQQSSNMEAYSILLLFPAHRGSWGDRKRNKNRQDQTRINKNKQVQTCLKQRPPWRPWPSTTSTIRLMMSCRFGKAKF